MKKPSNFVPRGVLKYVVGDATMPKGSRMRYVIHICNNIGAWGSGFVVALSKKWPKAEQSYRSWWREKNGKLVLGEIQVVQVASDLAIINMIAQEGCGLDKDGNPPIRYEALQKCLAKVGEYVSDNSGAVHGPRFGAGLAGGSWDKIEAMIEQELLKRSVDVTIYDLEEK